MSKRIHDYEWLRRNIMAISFTCGFLVALYGISLKASEHPANDYRHPATITINGNNQQQSVNYNEVDKFISAQDVKAIKTVAKNNNKIILSEKPIIIIKAYAPTSFADLGLRFNRNRVLVKFPNFEIAINNVRRLPTIPPFTASSPKSIVAVAPKSIESAIITQELSAAQPAIYSTVLWLVTAISTFGILSMLLVSSRRNNTRRHYLSYVGKLGRATDMIGSGDMFDFSMRARSLKTTSVNASYVNLLWQLGRFSKCNTVDTYFYNGFYIPNQQGYAQALRKSVTKKEKTT